MNLHSISDTTTNCSTAIFSISHVENKKEFFRDLKRLAVKGSYSIDGDTIEGTNENSIP